MLGLQHFELKKKKNQNSLAARILFLIILIVWGNNERRLCAVNKVGDICLQSHFCYQSEK